MGKCDIARFLYGYQPVMMIMARSGRQPPASLAFWPGMLMFFLYDGPQPAPIPRKEALPMALNICWLDDLAKAKDHARQTKKPVLLDFFNPQ
jgi:hypothetical protein